jgi:hypothetical protein
MDEEIKLIMVTQQDMENPETVQWPLKYVGESMNYPSGETPGLWTGGHPIIYNGKEFIPTNTIVD